MLPVSFVGINDIPNIQGLAIYPNPVSEKLTIGFNSPTTGVFQFTIYDITGRKYYSGQSVAENGENLVSIPTSDLEQGVYVLEIMLDDKTVRTIFIRN
jgi:hypothetical protein